MTVQPNLPQEVDLGIEDSFTTLPTSVTVAERDYFLTKGKDGSYRLLSNLCPHRAGEIIEWDTCFMCPDHGWRFEREDGVCINGPNARMFSMPVAVRDGRLFALLSEDQTPTGWGRPTS